MTQKERRKNARRNISVPVSIEDSEGVIDGIAKDISLNGIKIESSEYRKPGTTVEIVLQLNEPTYLEGIVVWKRKEGSGDNAYFVMGVQAYAIIHHDIKAIGFPDKLELYDELMERLALMDSDVL